MVIIEAILSFLIEVIFELIILGFFRLIGKGLKSLANYLIKIAR